MQLQSIPCHPLANIFPLMAGRDYAELVADIQAHGVHEPIILLDGQVLDGRNRLRACADAGREPKFEIYAGDNPVGFVVSRNLRRHHLNESQRAVVAAKIANLGQGRPREQNALPGKPANLPVLQSDAASMLNVSERSVRAGKVVVERAVPELTAKVERGEVPVSAAADVATLPKADQREVVAKGEAEILKAANRIRADQARARKEERAQQIAKAAEGVRSVSERYTLIHGPLINALQDVEAGSVDFILTDPPCPKEFPETFERLSEVGAHVLKDNGLLICLSGQTYLPAVLASLRKSLTYRWMLVYLTPGEQVFSRRVNTFWKPVLVFSKDAYTGRWFGAVTKSDVIDNDKEHHHWSQPVSGMRDLMKRFVVPGTVVMDPFLGGGTTAVVALELGASFIGYDVEASAIETTKARLADAKLIA